MDDIYVLNRLFTEYFGKGTACDAQRISGSGGNRRYYRLSRNNDVCIGCIGDNLRENQSFIALSACFRDAGIDYTPQVLAVSEDGMAYLQTDLGKDSLLDIIKSGNYEKMIVRTLHKLVKLQNIDLNIIKDCTEYGPFDKRQIFWDLNYFKYEYLKPLSYNFDESALEDDFEALANDLLKAAQKTYGFMWRDCQSRNIYIKGGEPYFIDYQGGRPGPGLYDAVSLLWQAAAGFDAEFRTNMLKVYATEFAEYKSIEPGEILADVDLFALFRTLQVLGAYGLRGLIEHKAHFIESIPGALSNLKELNDRGVLDKYPELKRLSDIAAEDTRFKGSDSSELTVTVFSFSYKKGYPADYSGNGGGFMFDCRGMHNPGRYAEYKELTGKDKPVIDFLEQRGEVFDFVDKAMATVTPSVDCYLRRGFKSLQIGFGCTGGRHRSVYCAERFSRLLGEKYPNLDIKIIHREQQ